MNELIDGTLADAIEVLAKRAAYRRVCPLTLAEKQALDSSDVITKQADLADHLSGTARSALLGAGIGTGLGALGTHFGNMKRDPDSRRSVLQGALLGGATGGALGGGIGKLKNIVNDAGISDVLREPEGPTPTVSGAGRDIKEVLNHWLSKGKAKVDELVTKGRDAGNDAIKGTQDYINREIVDPVRDHTQTSRKVLPALAVADAVMHAPGVGINRLVRPELFGGDKSYQATGPLGKQMLEKGLDSPTAKAIDKDLITAIVRNDKSGVQPTRASTTKGEVITSTVPHRGENLGIKEQLLQGRVEPSNDPVLTREIWKEKTVPSKVTSAPSGVNHEFAPGGKLTGNQYKDIMQSGNAARMDAGGRAAMQLKVPFLGSSPRVTYKAPTALGRVGVYAGLPLVEAAGRHYLGDDQGNLNVGKRLSNFLFSPPAPQTDIGGFLNGAKAPQTNVGMFMNGKQ